ncbi:MAG TPA: tetratricopeptide repeat protein [Candidatus Eisenbacteria bacterium]|nr:tetratricopeptide repeat protein [Candidatus Eisenbacteria bacterium]
MTRAKPAARRAGLPWLLAILALTFVAYLPSLGNGFTNWDDQLYLDENPFLRESTVGEVLTTPVASNWHPLTIWSFAINYKLFGLDPASYHWINLLLHLANTALVFLFVRGLAKDRFWAIVVTSLFFGIHPMHVESVAWIAERKDVLYTLFYLLGLLAYVRYLDIRRWPWLGGAFAAFVLSVAAKPAAVVFPATLLAIDYFRRRPFDARALLEKAPFFAVSIAAAILTLQAQEGTGAINREELGPLVPRILVASFGLMMYVVKLFLPTNLSAFYPYPENPATNLGPEFTLAFVLVVVLLPAAIYFFRRNRAILFGIAFFLINVVLVLQFFSVGHAVMADRYTYVPYIGLLFALGWGLDERPAGSSGLIAMRVLTGVLLFLAPVSLYQTWTRCQVWRNSGTLWNDVIRQYPGRIVDAHNSRGRYLYQEEGRLGEALADFDQAIALNPRIAQIWLDKGIVLARMGLPDSALVCFDEAVRIKPDFVPAWSNRGGMKLQGGDIAGAIADFSEAIRIDPAFRDAYANRAIAYSMTREFDRSIADNRRVIELDPTNPNNYLQLGAIAGALEELGRHAEAVAACDEALRLAPASEPRRGAYSLLRSRALAALGNRLPGG